LEPLQKREAELVQRIASAESRTVCNPDAYFECVFNIINGATFGSDGSIVKNNYEDGLLAKLFNIRSNEKLNPGDQSKRDLIYKLMVDTYIKNPMPNINAQDTTTGMKIYFLPDIKDWNYIPEAKPKRFFQINFNEGPPYEGLKFFIDHWKGNIKDYKAPEQANPVKKGGALLTNLHTPDLIEEQLAWENMLTQYNSLESEYQQLLPEPDDAPLYTISDPIHKYMNDFADHERLEEAREALNLLSPDHIQEPHSIDMEVIERVKPYYRNAFPHTRDEWIPILIKADVLKKFLDNQ